MSGTTTAFWGMTINNYDETDLAMVRHGYPDYMREMVYTLEKGEEGTPHIQAWLKLQRQQRLSFVKKLFPRGHFKPLVCDEYIENTKRYAQKLDSTAEGGAVHKFNDPMKTIESVIPKVAMLVIDGMDMMYGKDNWEYSDREAKEQRVRILAQYKLVKEDFRYAKIFSSPVYKRMWEEYGFAMVENIREKSRHTHTHTHSDEKFSREGGITNDADASEDGSREEGSDTQTEDGQDYQNSSDSEDEGYAEGTDSGCSE